MLQCSYLTEHDLKDFGFKSLGTNVRISSDARVYGAERISIGSHVRIDDFAMLASGQGYVTVGDYVYIARCSTIMGTFGIEIRDFASMAANTVIYSASDDYSGKFMTAQAIPREFTRFVGGPVILDRHVIMGSACTVLGASHIGEGCSIGAMSLVTKDLAPWGIYAGIPVRRLKDRKRDLLELEKTMRARLG